MFVAVVYKYHYDTDPTSHKPEGDWSSFLGATKEEAVKAAEVATRRWETQYDYKKDANGNYQKVPYGPYQILVGELTEEVDRFPISLKLVDGGC